MKKEIKTLLIVIIITFIIAILFTAVLISLIDKNSECYRNPFVYAANTIIDQEGNNIYALCSCSVNENNFYFDNKGIYKDNPLLKTVIP